MGRLVWMEWDVLEREAATAAENMEFDAELLRQLGTRKNPILHLYAWKRPSVTYGHFIDPKMVINVEEAERAGIDLSRRPTGGGVVFHLWDLAFSVLVPASCSLFSENTLANYGLVNRVVQDVVRDTVGLTTSLTPIDAQVTFDDCKNFCMARPTKYDVMLEGKKIAGAAQRKTKDGFLHQGTIAIVSPDMELATRLLAPEVCAAMAQSTFPLFNDLQDLDNGRKQITERLKRFFIEL